MSETGVARRRVLLPVLVALAAVALCGLVVAGIGATAMATSMSDSMSQSMSQSMAAPLPLGVTSASSSTAESDTRVMGCDGSCASGSAQACTVVLGLTSMSLLGLLLVSRRHTYLGLGPRPPRSQATRSEADPRRDWWSLSPLDLCVIRV